MNKFGRIFKLTIGTNDGLGDIIIQPPLTIFFNAVRRSSGSTGDMQLQVYNLSYSNRKRIFQDIYQTGGLPNYKKIKLEAGYAGNLSAIFQGNYTYAATVREGTNLVTYITSQDGGWDTANVKTFTTLKGGTLTTDTMKQLAGDFKNIKLGQIVQQSPQSTGRPVVLEGNTWDLIRKYTGPNDQVFIDLEVLNVLGNKYALKGSVPLINASSGLLSTPRREGAIVLVTMLLEPALILGQIINLQSSVQPEYSGQYKVNEIRHTGSISEAVNGKCVTTLSLVRPDQANQGYSVI